MDKILEGYLNSFITENGLEYLEKEIAFEQLVNFNILSRVVSDQVDLDSVSVGGGGDTSIDGIALIVNDHIITCKEDIDYFKKLLHRFDVKFVFTQAKTSEKFEMGEMGNFLFGVRSFFEKQPLPKANPRIQNAHDLKEYIYQSAIDMDESPICEMFYVTSGIWANDSTLEARIKADLEALRSTKLFSEVKFNPVDAEQFKKIHRELRNRIVKKINFEKHTTLPSIDGVHQAYIGVLPALEYLKLITDDDDNLQRNLFYDNVRDFQGNNSVNQEIACTINIAKNNDRFSLLNNGITIVAKSINQVGNVFTIRDFQIVNGCQTSHVIFLNKKSVTDKVYLPVKLIVTEDLEVTNMVIKATNRQTEVKIEAFESLLPFHKKLEEYYETFKSEKRLYYERRSKQYNYLPIKENQIISITNQTKCFLAMFLNEPHSTHRYYGELLKAYEDKIFLDSHNPFPYYISGYALHLLEQFFFQKQLLPQYKPYRFHLLMAFRLIIESSELPFLNSKKIDKYCSDMKAILDDTNKALSMFQRATHLIDQLVPKLDYNVDEAPRRKAFTSDLIMLASKENKLAKSKQTNAATVDRLQGTVIWFSDIKGYGFIKGQYINNIFVHFSDIKGDKYSYKNLLPNQIVEFVVAKTEKGWVAKNVVVVD
ncbi:MAG TPA: AIPR family protein [Anaerolineales bacterium]|jgi:cold shock CspA family protein